MQKWKLHVDEVISLCQSNWSITCKGALNLCTATFQIVPMFSSPIHPSCEDLGERKKPECEGLESDKSPKVPKILTNPKIGDLGGNSSQNKVVLPPSCVMLCGEGAQSWLSQISVESTVCPLCFWFLITSFLIRQKVGASSQIVSPDFCAVRFLIYHHRL